MLYPTDDFLVITRNDFCMTLHVYKLIVLYISVSIQTVTVPATIPIINVSYAPPVLFSSQ